MNAPRGTRWAVCTAAVLLAAVLAAAPAGAALEQDPPTRVVPQLPDDLDPLTAGLSPVLWQACDGVGLAVGLIVLAGTLAGVPPEAGVPLNEAIATASGPVLRTFFEVCQQIPLPETAPDCQTDQLLPLLPSLGRPLLPAALLANELRALGTSLEGAGLPLQGALGDAADALLACAAGRNPQPDAPAADPEPDPVTAPDATEPAGTGGPTRGGGAPPRSPSGGALAAPDLGPSGPAPASGAPLAVARPAGSADGGTSTGVAMALLGAAALAGLGWVHAGRARPERALAAPALAP